MQFVYIGIIFLFPLFLFVNTHHVCTLDLSFAVKLPLLRSFFLGNIVHTIQYSSHNTIHFYWFPKAIQRLFYTSVNIAALYLKFFIAVSMSRLKALTAEHKVFLSGHIRSLAVTTSSLETEKNNLSQQVNSLKGSLWLRYLNQQRGRLQRSISWQSLSIVIW